MLRRIKTELRVAYYFLRGLRQQGYKVHWILLYHAPKIAISRLYAKLAKKINSNILNPILNRNLICKFHKSHHEELGQHFYLIVMPGVLHFLVPCLKLIPKKIPLFLLFNGTKEWEIQYLNKHFPDIPGLRLKTLPASCLAHGDVITLLLKNNNKNFGILDHDLYLFDKEVFTNLEFETDECLLAIYAEQSDKTGFIYPHTCFLFFNVSLISSLMSRYKIDANLYKKVPARLKDKLSGIGLTDGIYLKDYHNFFDTLNLILAMAFTEKLQVHYMDLKVPSKTVHVGGTSMGQHITKDLPDIYVRLRFLEYVNDAFLFKKYSYWTKRFKNSAEIIPLMTKTPRVVHLLTSIDALMLQLNDKTNK